MLSNCCFHFNFDSSFECKITEKYINEHGREHRVITFGALTGLSIFLTTEQATQLAETILEAIDAERAEEIHELAYEDRDMDDNKFLARG